MAQPPSRPPRDLPQVPDSVDPAIRGPLSRVIEEVQRLLQFRGDPLDAALTFRKAIARGVLDSVGRALTGNVTYVNTFPTSGGGGGGDAPDLTPPPTVTGLSIVAGFTQVIVQFDAPVYTQGHGNLQTNIYAVKKAAADLTLPTFDSMTPLVFAAPGALNIVSLPSELNTRWHVWAKHKTVDGVLSAVAAGGINGVSGTTAQDIVQLMQVLTGQIRMSHLYAALAEPIRSIVRRADDAAEDSLRALVAAHQAATRAKTALLGEAASRGTAITETRTLVTTGDAQLASTITTLTAAVATNRTEALAGIETEAVARAGGDEAQATLRETLATQLRGTYAGTDVALLTTGLIHSERTARSTADGTLSSRSDTLESKVDTPSTGLLARATALEVVTTHATSGNSALAGRASTLEVSVNSPTNINNPTYAALTAESSARVTYQGYASTLYSVRTTVTAGGRTLSGGFGLAGTSGGTAGPTIDFGVLANKFYVGAPNDGSAPGVGDIIPFTILTVDTVESGVPIPKGVYIDAAFIRNLTALYARIGNLVADSITAASINVSQLVAGSLAVGAYAQSTGYVSGTTGFRISGNGFAEFSGVIVRGTIFASAGSIGGNTIDSTGIQSPGYTVGSTGFRFDASGLLRAFASGGARVFDMAATGTQPVLKIGAALELLANGASTYAGSLNINSGGSSRMEITDTRIKIFNGGVERVRLGDLS